jgi:hypothetical protein
VWGGGGGDEGCNRGGGVNVQKYTIVIQCCSEEIFFRAKHFFVWMMIADSPLLGQSATHEVSEPEILVQCQILHLAGDEEHVLAGTPTTQKYS